MGEIDVLVAVVEDRVFIDYTVNSVLLEGDVVIGSVFGPSLYRVLVFVRTETQLFSFAAQSSNLYPLGIVPVTVQVSALFGLLPSRYHFTMIVYRVLLPLIRLLT